MLTLVKDVRETIGWRLAEYRAKRTHKHGLDAPKFARGPFARSVGRMAASDVSSVL